MALNGEQLATLRDTLNSLSDEFAYKLI